MKKVSKRQTIQNYAQALYEAALKEDKLEIARRDCETMARVSLNFPQLDFLANPALPHSSKIEIASHVATALKLSAPTANFLKLIILNGKISLLKYILAEFKHIYYHEQNIMEVTVESVKEFSAAQEKKLLSGLEKNLKQKIILNYKINPQLLGGLVIQYGSVCIDDSLAGKLKRLDEVMKGNA